MGLRALGPATLAVVGAIVRGHAGEDVLVACSGGADSLALAHGVRLGGARRGPACPAPPRAGGGEAAAPPAKGAGGRLRAAGDEGRIDQERVRGGIALREQPERAEQEPQTREKDAEFHGKTRGKVNRVWPG